MSLTLTGADARAITRQLDRIDHERVAGTAETRASGLRRSSVLSDGVSFWGGNDARSAARRYAEPLQRAEELLRRTGSPDAGRFGAVVQRIERLLPEAIDPDLPSPKHLNYAPNVTTPWFQATHARRSAAYHQVVEAVGELRGIVESGRPQGAGAGRSGLVAGVAAALLGIGIGAAVAGTRD